MKTFILSATILLMFGIILQPSVVSAADAAELYIKLTCNTCHGPEGKGMVRTETKEKYYFRKKKMYKQMVKDGMPVEVVKKLQPLYKKKFKEKDDFVKAIEEHIGQADTEKYKDIAIKVGGRIYYRKGDLIPGFEDYPRHAGNKKLYLYRQMKDILEGKRTNGNSEAMRGVKPFVDSNNITDDDYMSIANYLSNIKVKE